ncbi:MAG: bifunctional riboflavin kinase/FAD synthetase [Clostridia bacterium]|nr:bifunctional riboflavin kinase/FAD synthetase [Clostridia bacterium]
MKIYDLKTMQLCGITENTVVALGTFDGCHKGHLSVFASCASLARQMKAKSVVYTFSSIPMTKSARCIFSLDEKIRLIKKFGIDYICIEDFENVSSLDGNGFFENILRGALKAQGAVCGFNFKFGNGGAFGAEDLKNMFENVGGCVQICEKTAFENEVLSSTLLRKFIENGDIEKLVHLASPYSIYAKVKEGKHLGRTIGVPTINQSIPKDKVIPKRGVYITECEIGEDVYPSITNVGVRPTTDPYGSEQNIETHIIGFDKELYGSFIRVNFYKFLRDERKFPSLDELKAQIQKDIEASKSYFF